MALITLIFLFASSCVALGALKDECSGSDAWYPSTGCYCMFPGQRGNVWFNCHNINSQKQLEDELSKLKGYSMKRLYLDNVNVSTLSASAFQGLHVLGLNLYNFDVEDRALLGQTPFSGLEDSLQLLTIAQNSFTRNGPLRSLKLGHLYSLEEIEMHIPTPEIGNEWFSGLTDLKILYLSYSGIEKLGDKAFATLTNVEKLWVPYNNLKEISRSMFPSPANHLVSLGLEYNKIKTLPTDIFTEMPALKGIGLAGNLLHTLDEATWSHIFYQVDAVSLQSNPINCDQDLKWVCLRRRVYGIYQTDCSSPDEEKGVNIGGFCKKNGLQHKM